MFTNGRTERFHSTQTKFGGAFYDLKKKNKEGERASSPGFYLFSLKVHAREDRETGWHRDFTFSLRIQSIEFKIPTPTPSYDDPPLLKITHQKGWSIVRSASHYTTTKKKKKKGNTFLKSPISKSKQNLQITNYQYCKKSINSYPWRNKTNFTHLRSPFFPSKVKRCKYVEYGEEDIY